MDKNETSSELEAKNLCDICNQPEDDDGRCGCTNKDAYGV